LSICCKGRTVLGQREGAKQKENDQSDKKKKDWRKKGNLKKKGPFFHARKPIILSKIGKPVGTKNPERKQAMRVNHRKGGSSPCPRDSKIGKEPKTGHRQKQKMGERTKNTQRGGKGGGENKIPNTAQNGHSLERAQKGKKRAKLPNKKEREGLGKKKLPKGKKNRPVHQALVGKALPQ